MKPIEPAQVESGDGLPPLSYEANQALRFGDAGKAYGQRTQELTASLQRERELVEEVERLKGLLEEEERSSDQLLTERDEYYEIAEKLSEAISEHFKRDIGEHSNLNDPFSNALEIVNAAITEKVSSR